MRRLVRESEPDGAVCRQADLRPEPAAAAYRQPSDLLHQPIDVLSPTLFRFEISLCGEIEKPRQEVVLTIDGAHGERRRLSERGQQRAPVILREILLRNSIPNWPILNFHTPDYPKLSVPIFFASVLQDLTKPILRQGKLQS